jgi:glucan phosphoethanolaminetransferase (alkaline phosphatase superfamily)
MNKAARKIILLLLPWFLVFLFGAIDFAIARSMLGSLNLLTILFLLWLVPMLFVFSASYATARFNYFTKVLPFILNTVFCLSVLFIISLFSISILDDDTIMRLTNESAQGSFHLSFYKASIGSMIQAGILLTAISLLMTFLGERHNVKKVCNDSKNVSDEYDSL